MLGLFVCSPPEAAAFAATNVELKQRSKFLNASFHRFSEKVLEMERSLETRLGFFQEKLCRSLDSKKQSEKDDQSLAVSSGLLETNVSSSSSGLIEEPLSHKSSDEFRYEKDLSHTGGGCFATDLSPYGFTTDSHQQWTDSLMSGVSSTEHNLSMSSLNQHQSKFSLFLYDHDNGSFCQLPDSVSSFCQVPDSASSFCQLPNNNNFDLPMFPPMMFSSYS